MSLFTSLPGSLLHPLLMTAFVLGWFYTGLLGLSVRRERTSADGANVSLLDASAMSGSAILKGKKHHKLSGALFASTVATMLLGMLSWF